MRYRFFVFVLVGFSCQTKPAEQNSTADTTQVVDASSASQTPATSSLPEKTFPSTYVIDETELDYNALLLPEGEIYSDSTGESTLVMTAETLLPIQTQATSKVASPIEGDVCDQYFWFRSSTAKERGWVYGKDLLQFREKGIDNAFEMNGISYDLGYLVDAGVGPSDKNGLTGCNQYSIPYFMNKKKNTMSFIRAGQLSFPTNSFTTSYAGYGWLSFVSSEGGSAEIQSVEYNKAESNIRVVLNVGTQMEGFKFNMILVEREGDFVLQSIDEINEN